jgi:hypothetical protein
VGATISDADPLARFAQRTEVTLIETSRADGPRDEVLARIVGIDRGQGRREAALLRISARPDGKGFSLSLS